MLQRLPALIRLSLFTLLSALILSGAIQPVPALARDASAKQFLQAIYRHYTGEHAAGIDLSSPENAHRYFEASVAGPLLLQDPDSEYEGSGLDFDPFANGQEIEIASVEIAIVTETAERAEAIAFFHNAGRPQKIAYDLVKTAEGWRITDMSWDGTKETLRSILAARR